MKIVQSIYRNAQSRFRVNGTLSDDFLVLVEYIWVSLFIIMLEALTRKIRSRCSEGLFDADDLTLVSEVPEGLKG